MGFGNQPYVLSEEETEKRKQILELTDEEGKNKILEEEYKVIDSNDSMPEVPVDWFPARDPIFTVLGRPGGTPVITKDQSIIDRADAREAKQIEHQENMKNDPAYAEKWNLRQLAMVSVDAGFPMGI